MRSDDSPARGIRAAAVDRVAGAALAVFSVLVLWECRGIPFGSMAEPGPGAVPVLLGILLLICGLALVFAGSPAERLSSIRWPEQRHAVAILGTCAFVSFALERLGYRLTIFVALLTLVSLVEKKGWAAGIVFAGVFSLGTYYLFDTLLKVPLPLGFFGL